MKCFMATNDQAFYGDNWWDVLWRKLMSLFNGGNDEWFYVEK